MLAAEDRAILKATPRVLVLLAAHNGAAWIGVQLDSILTQADVDVEILVSDDASTDDTLADVQSAAANDPRVRCIHRPVGHGSAAGNFISLLADADIQGFTHVALSDQDDVWFSSKLHAACLCLENSGADLYSAAALAQWPDGRTAVLRQSSRITRADFLFEGGGQGCTFVLTARLFTRVQSFVRDRRDLLSSLHYHDWLIYGLARVWEFRWFYDPRPCLQYRQHAYNDTGARTGAGGRRRRVTLIRSGWYSLQVQSIIRIYLCAGSSTDVGHVHRLLVGARGSFASRLRLAFYLLRYGRRRFSDRIVLFVSACFNYI